MKLLLVIAFAVLTQTAFAGVDCVGTTVIFNEEGNATSVDTQLKKVQEVRGTATYFAESEVFQFWVEHDVKEKVVSLEVLDKKNVIVINNPRMKLAKFNVSIGGYWKTYFTSLNCTPTEN